MIHRRALITGLLASVAAPAMVRLAPDTISIETSADNVLWEHYGMPMPVPVGWRTYWDGVKIVRHEISWDKFYQRN